MKKLFKKVLSLFLVFAIVFNTSINVFASNNEESIIIDGYYFKIIIKDWKGVKLSYSDQSGNYIFYLDKKDSNEDAVVEITKVNAIQTYSESNNLVSNYQIKFDKNIEYTEDTNDFSSTMLIDQENGREYRLDPKSRIAFVIPVGIPLVAAAIEALLAVGGVILIAGVAYTLAEEVVEALKKQNKYKYYAAVLRKNAVYVGGGLTTSQAKPLAYSNDSKGTIFATSFSYARGLAGNSYRGPENHGSTEGYWPHIHARSYTFDYEAHIWYAP